MITVQPNILSVTQVNTYIKSVIDGDINLSSIIIVGEISNFTNHYRTGHFYFTLKDETSSLKAVMFRNANMRLGFLPENGMKVICFGRVSVYERDGQYQLYVEDIQPDGVGSLKVRYEQLKTKLEKEGLFDPEHKKSLPERPTRIGVVTSPTGAALQDIINVISRRFPLCEIVLSPAEVQGENAPSSLKKALKKLDELNYVELIIIARGGGSIEDLWAFNNEELSRAVFKASTPVISAVGHETDFTICDFVADLRAPTPSAAAEIAVPDINDEIAYVNALRSFSKETVLSKIDDYRNRVRELSSTPCFYSRKTIVESYNSKVSELKNSLDRQYSKTIEDNFCKALSLYSKLDVLDPLKVLIRGYSIVLKDGKSVNSVQDVAQGSDIDIRMSDGNMKCKVLETEMLK